MTAEILQQAASLAERLAADLRLTANDHSLVYGARNDLIDLEKVLPELRQALNEIKRARAFEQISGAFGDAATHRWEVDEDGEIHCPVCSTHPVGYLLADGRVPVCDPASPCQHALLGGDDGEGKCIYCKSTYWPSGPREGVTR